MTIGVPYAPTILPSVSEQGRWPERLRVAITGGQRFAPWHVIENGVTLCRGQSAAGCLDRWINIREVFRDILGWRVCLQCRKRMHALFSQPADEDPSLLLVMCLCGWRGQPRPRPEAMGAGHEHLRSVEP